MKIQICLFLLMSYYSFSKMEYTKRTIGYNPDIFDSHSQNMPSVYTERSSWQNSPEGPFRR